MKARRNWKGLKAGLKVSGAEKRRGGGGGENSQKEKPGKEEARKIKMGFC